MALIVLLPLSFSCTVVIFLLSYRVDGVKMEDTTILLRSGARFKVLRDGLDFWHSPLYFGWVETQSRHGGD